MPNTCYNNFKFVGNRETIDELIKSNFSFSYFFPPPVNASYQWYEENWCAVNEAGDVELNRTAIDVLYITCKTKWTVPINFLKNLIKKFPDLYIFNQYNIMFTDCGIIILYIYNNEIVEKEFTWFDPMCKEYIAGVYESN